MSLERLLTFWKNTPQIHENITHWEQVPARQARTTAIPDSLSGKLRTALQAGGIDRLYSHQAESLAHLQAGRHVIVATGTASGKTLCYNLPIIESALADPETRALYLFPTKALAQDQLKGIRLLTQHIDAAPPAAIYDGDTPGSHRPGIRENARLVLSNPDMVHLGILPYHTRWADFFRSLKFIVIDETHYYRGVFGSHVANVLRRLKRIALHYGAAPQFILTSATIGNPVELAEKLIEAPVELVDDDGSARGAQHFLVYNPPVIDEELNLRRSVLQESVFIAGDLLTYQVQHIIFGRSRRMVELILRNLQEAVELKDPAALRSYRSGYLPAQRREIEQGIRAGKVRAVAATNALELGIDIGGMGAVVLAGYPGTISGAWQQAGRAGRGMEDSLAVLLTNSSPLDQYLAGHPEYLFGNTPESALVNPDNLLILLDHIRCAAFEHPFLSGEGFGLIPGETVQEFLDILAAGGGLMQSGEQYFWTAEDAPAQRISLRNASAQRVALVLYAPGEAPRTFGEVDGESASWMVHPGAVYLHQAESFLVEALDLEEGHAHLAPFEMDYYTEAVRDTEVSLVRLSETTGNDLLSRSHGDVRVTEQVTGYRKIQWSTGQRLAVEPLDMPPAHMETTGYWITLEDPLVDRLREAGLWGADANTYGPDWSRLRDAVRARDGYTCQSCGVVESGRQHDVHHKTPFRAFDRPEEANRMSNLVTLCPACHRKVEAAVRVRSGLAGLSYVIGNLAPLFLMCDPSDIMTHADPKSPLGGGRPTVIVYERIPAGIGFAQKLFEIHDVLLQAALARVLDCGCGDGCPSCVGPGGELGQGGKLETRAILELVRG